MAPVDATWRRRSRADSGAAGLAGHRMSTGLLCLAATALAGALLVLYFWPPGE